MPLNFQDKKQYSRRKKEHIALALKPENSALGMTGFEHIHLPHSALPEIDFSEVDISTKVFGKKMLTPFMVSGMTAGWPGAAAINQKIAEACAKRGWLMGIGSQRGELSSDSKHTEPWQKILKKHPKLMIMGNIGLSQVIKTPLQKIEKLAKSLSAAAMAVHTNPLQEALQHEGTPQFKGGLKALKALCKKLKCPVVLKETGCGFSYNTLKTLKNIGFYAVDVSGLGGTHWGRIEGKRIPKNHPFQGLEKAFQSWGIPTTAVLLSGGKIKTDYEIWASGGITDGCTAAKAFALGAKVVGFARPLLKALLKGGIKGLDRQMARIEQELKVALFCTGSKNIKELRQAFIIYDKQKNNL